MDSVKSASHRARATHRLCIRGWSSVLGSPALERPVDEDDPRTRGSTARARPGVTIPTRFSGSAALTRTASPVRAVRRMRRRASTASGSAYCSPRNPATKRPPRTRPRASRARRRAQHVPPWDGEALARRRARGRRRRTVARSCCATRSATSSRRGSPRASVLSNERPPALGTATAPCPRPSAPRPRAMSSRSGWNPSPATRPRPTRSQSAPVELLAREARREREVVEEEGAAPPQRFERRGGRPRAWAAPASPAPAHRREEPAEIAPRASAIGVAREVDPVAADRRASRVAARAVPRRPRQRGTARRATRRGTPPRAARGRPSPRRRRQSRSPAASRSRRAARPDRRREPAAPRW